jgi:hypothetical protein
MATTVYEVSELVLQDGTSVLCKPANIKVMRKGTELLTNSVETESDDDGIDRLLDIVAVCLKNQRPEFEHEVEVEGVRKKETNYELMYELFDMDTVFEIIHKFLGIKLNDPKLLETAAQMALLQAQQEASLGTNSNSQD